MNAITNAIKNVRTCLLAWIFVAILVAILQPLQGLAQQNSDSSNAKPEGSASLASTQESSPASSADDDRPSQASQTLIRQAMNEAWWTGPMLAPNATTLPRGHL